MSRRAQTDAKPVADLPGVGELAAFDLLGLRKAWRQRFSEDAPPYASKQLLLLALAYRLQVANYRDLRPAAKKRLTELEHLFRKDPEFNPAPKATPSVGSAMVRDWNGVRHVVLVTTEGFQYLDKTYGSLTQVAKAITGTHQSGPVFFDLTKRSGR